MQSIDDVCEISQCDIYIQIDNTPLKRSSQVRTNVLDDIKVLSNAQVFVDCVIYSTFTVICIE